jgi:hypothetical protein
VFVLAAARGVGFMTAEVRPYCYQDCYQPNGRAHLDLGRIDRCIYCGATGDLATEHVIPRSLGGGHYLRKASCLDCARITSLIETRISRDTFLLFRTVLDLPTRDPRKRPTHFQGRVRRGNVWTEEEVPVRIPGAAVFPNLPVPGLLEGRPATNRIRTLGGIPMIAIRRADPSEEVARRAGIDEVQVDISWHPPAFMRLLAKIGWGSRLHCSVSTTSTARSFRSFLDVMPT